MASNHTENFNLCQWLAGDAVLRSDFNADNQKIDAALKLMPRFLAGSYIGDGLQTGRSLCFQFNPILVIITADSEGGTIPGSVFINGQTMSDGIGNYDNPAYGMGIHLTWGDNQVSWYSSTDLERGLNVSGQVYRFFALGF